MDKVQVLRLNVTPDAEGYITAVSSSEVLADQMMVVEIEGRKIILTRVQGQVCAFTNRCPHAGADLSEGELYKGKIECPDHRYVFDVRNGRILWPEDEPLRLKRYKVKEEHGVVKILVNSNQ